MSADEANFNAEIASINRLLPNGFEATVAINKNFPVGRYPKGKLGRAVQDAAVRFSESTILPVVVIPKQRGVRGLLCVAGPLDSLYTVDAARPSLADRELLIAWLMVSGNLVREKAEIHARKMQG